jgi:hypothetical protein
MAYEKKPSGNPDLIEQHKRKQRMGDNELADKPGKDPEPERDTNAGGSAGEGGTQP